MAGDLTILDNDGASVGLTTTSAVVDEAAGTVTLTVQVDAAVSGGFTVDYTLVDGSAAGLGVDFGSVAGATGTLIFTGTALETQDIVIPITDDSIIEAAENFTVDLSNVVSVTAIPGAITIDPAAETATVTITDNDGDATVSVVSATVDESAGTITVTVSVDEAVQDGFDVDYTTSDNSAVAGSDYVSTNGTLTFAGGVAGETQTFTLDITEDSVVEALETLDIELSNVVPVSVPVANVLTSDGTISITDNDGNATVSVTSATVDESAGTITVTVSVDKAVQDGFDVDFTTSDGSAIFGSDYVPTNGTLTFVGGTAGETQTFTMDIVDDSVIEALETLNIELSNVDPVSVPAANILTSDGTISITDNDGDATVSVVSATVDESAGTITVTVSVDNAVQDGFDVDYTTSDVSAVAGSDYVATNGTLTFAGGVAGETQTFTLDITDDSAVEALESLDVQLSNVVPVSAPVASILTSDGTISITDNDGDATVSVVSATVDESAGTITVTVSVDKAVQDGFDVDYTTSDGSALDGSDYDATNGTLTFVGGTAGETQTFTLDITDDSLVEALETLNIELSNVVPVSVPVGNILTSDGTISITDNDSAVVTLTSVNSAASEQPTGAGVTNGVFDLKLSNPSSTATVVDFTAIPDSNQTLGAIREGFETSSLAHLQGDYRILLDDLNGNVTVVSGNTFTIPAGVTDMQVIIEVIDDVVVETPENFDLNLTVINSADPQISVGTPTGGNVTITDDDQAEIIVKSVKNASEPGQTADDNGFFEVLLIVPGSIDANNPEGIPAPVSYDIEVGISVTGTANQIPGDPNDPVDFEELEPVEFAPGVTTDVITVTPEDDFLVEGDETVILTLTPNDVDSNILDNLFNQNVTEVFVTSDANCNGATVIIEDNDFGDPGEVSGIYVNGSNWAPEFLDRVDGVSDGSTYGYELTGRPDQTETLPWINSDTFVVEFDQTIDATSLDVSDFQLSLVPGSLGFEPMGAVLTQVTTAPAIMSAVPGPGGNTAILTLSSALRASHYLLDVNASGITFSSVAGTDFRYDFLSLPADADNMGMTVNSDDINDVASRSAAFAQIFGATGTFGPYSFRADLDGNNVINSDDVQAAVGLNFSLVVPGTVPPSFAPSSFSKGAGQGDDLRGSDPANSRTGVAGITKSSGLAGSVAAGSDLGSLDDAFEDLFGNDNAKEESGRSNGLNPNKFEFTSGKQR